MKKIYAINGSPRKNWNTATLLDKALEGAKAVLPVKGLWERFLEGFFGQPEVMYAFNTYQFDDYTKYVSDYFDEKDKVLYRDRQFGADCDKAYQIGKNVVGMK